jgi:predicted RNA-binding Zn-ribbon protein involved in translation (DUF1610 family)
VEFRAVSARGDPMTFMCEKCGAAIKSAGAIVSVKLIGKKYGTAKESQYYLCENCGRIIEQQLAESKSRLTREGANA